MSNKKKIITRNTPSSVQLSTTSNENNKNSSSFLFQSTNNESTNNDTHSVNLILPVSRNLVVSSIGPAALVGGSAVIYTSLLQHPGSTLNQLSLILMMLLAVQYAVQPRLSRKYISPKVNKQSVALVEEVVKTGLAAVIFFLKPSTAVRSALKDWSLSSSIAIAGLPAMLYALQGVLQYVSYQYLDSVTFNGLTQTKTLSAAFCCWLIMKKSQSPTQIFALGILFGSALVFQGYVRPKAVWDKVFRGNNKIKKSGTYTNGNSTDITTTANATPPTTKKDFCNNNNNRSVRQKKNDEWVWFGIMPCLGAAFLSGLAGALSQKGLQLTGIGGRDPFLYTIEISFFSAIALLFSIIRSNHKNDFSLQLEWQKQKKYWNWKTLIPIVLKAFGGVVTALVHKYAGSVSKGFALMFGLVLSNMIQSTTKQEPLQPYQIFGTIMIMISTWLHFTNPTF